MSFKKKSHILTCEIFLIEENNMDHEKLEYHNSESEHLKDLLIKK